jgi:hypothetical protein
MKSFGCPRLFETRRAENMLRDSWFEHSLTCSAGSRWKWSRVTFGIRLGVRLRGGLLRAPLAFGGKEGMQTRRDTLGVEAAYEK